MSEKINELEAKIIAEMETQLSAAIKNRDALPNGSHDPAFWTHQAEFTRLTQEIARRKRRIEKQ